MLSQATRATADALPAVLQDPLIAHLKEKGILSVFHYLPLHLSEMGQKFGGRAGDCPVTEDVSDRLLRLPFYNSLSEADQTTVIETVREFSCPAGRSAG